MLILKRCYITLFDIGYLNNQHYISVICHVNCDTRVLFTSVMLITDVVGYRFTSVILLTDVKKYLFTLVILITEVNKCFSRRLY